MRITIIKNIKISIKLILGILVLTATMGNSGCLVDTGSALDTLKKLSQDYLRIYKDGDRIKYDVVVDGMIKGTLTIAYDTPLQSESPDADPLTAGTTYIPNVLKETTTLAYEGNLLSTVRYITQDQDPLSPTRGSMTLHAFVSQSSTTEHNYASTNNLLDLNNALEPPVIFSSPFLETVNTTPITFQPISGQADENIDYYVFQCTEQTNQCELYNQRLTETFELSKMKVYDLSNKVDYFETVQVPYNGTAMSLSGGTDLRKINLDIRTFCGDPTETSINYSGSEFLYPSIGVVRFEIYCTGTQFSYLTAELSSVSFSY
jgi:hypothetical protein